MSTVALTANGNVYSYGHFHSREVDQVPLLGKKVTKISSGLWHLAAMTDDGEILDEEAVVNLIVSPQGLFKGVPDGCRKYVVLNKAENAQRRTYAENILIRLMKRDYIPFTTCVIASMTRNRVYL